MTDLFAAARTWAAQDPDAADRAEIEKLLVAPGESARAQLADRFADRLHFGTAGLRGAVGAGPNRMNRAVVRQTTVALARWLNLHVPDAGRSGVVVGCDARHRSGEFADEVTAVLSGQDIRVHRLDDRWPTPLLAFAVRHLGAAAGVMITASHNPPADNGYKLYLGDGAQIVPPVDEEIEALIEQVGACSKVPLGELSGPRIEHHGDDVSEAYLEALLAAVPAAIPPAQPLSVVYTPMHGVAGPLFLEAIRAAGYPPPLVVPAQAEPDPDFPTVPFPNPEEPGALDLAFAEARAVGADLVLANDPDGDRLAVAIPDGSTASGWRRLSGDEVGVLLGAFVLDGCREQPRSADDDRACPLVAASIVSSSMLEKIAADAGVPFVAVLTGFKWIVRAVTAVPGSRLVFGYEEALGYVVGNVVRDKDGIGAALAFLALAGDLRARGMTIESRIAALMRRYGVHLTAQHSIPTPDAQQTMRRLRARPPKEIAGLGVERALDLGEGCKWQEGALPLPPADVVAFWLSSGDRVIVRPSGTEPKLKSYLEVVRAVNGDDLDAAMQRAQCALADLRAALPSFLGS